MMKLDNKNNDKSNNIKTRNPLFQASIEEMIEASESSVGVDFFVNVGRGWLGKCLSVHDEENLVLEDEQRNRHIVNIFKLRGLENSFAA